MDYESLKYERIIPSGKQDVIHYLVRVYSACEVPGMIDISVYKTGPDYLDKKIYQLYLFANKMYNMPQFKRFDERLRRAIHTGITANVQMPYNWDSFYP